MRIASLDLGSNSFLCLIVEVETEILKISKIIIDEVRIVRLSEGLQRTGFISEASLQRAKIALGEFKEIIDEHKVDKVIAVTTAVARQASNAKIFLDLVTEFGFSIKILSGLEEAEITYLGASSGFNNNKELLVIDIGGGSTEVIFGSRYSKSFNFGVVRLKEKFSVQYPINDKLTQTISQYIDDELSIDNIYVAGEFLNIVAVAGTPTTLAAMDIGKYDSKLVDGYIFSLESLKNWYDRLSQLKPEDIVNLYCIDAGRADLIAIGVLILIRVLSFLSLNEIVVSIRGVRYGVILQDLLKGNK